MQQSRYFFSFCKQNKIWNAAREEVPERRVANIRGHRGFMVSAIFSTEHSDIVLTSSDDQTVKGWDIKNIKNIKPPNKKRPKNRKKAQGGEEDSDDDTETYSHTNTQNTNDGKFVTVQKKFGGVS